MLMHRLLVRLRVGVALAALLAVAAPVAGAEPRGRPGTAVEERSAPLPGPRTFALAGPVTHVAVRWRGARSALVDVALSRDGRSFGAWKHVELDEVGLRARPGTTFGKVMLARGVRAIRVRADRRLQQVTVLGMADRRRPPRRAVAASHLTTGVTPRSGWGADESLRFDRRDREIWPPEFWPVQKLVVHHTAGDNDDPDPAATIRAIYHYHAVTQGWGDIGYNFLVDEAGRVYEGRYSGPAGDADPAVDGSPGEDGAGNGVTAGHAYGYNAGTVGVALLGTLTDEDAEDAARTALEEFLGWDAERHGLEPTAAGTYTNPVTGTATDLPHIFGHRDVTATECPGTSLYGTLQDLRTDASARIARATSATFRAGATPTDVKVVRGTTSAPVTVSVERIGEFAGDIALRGRGLPDGAVAQLSPEAVRVDGLTPSASATLTIATTTRTPTGTYLLRVEGSAPVGDGLIDTRAATVKVQITRR